MTTSPSTPPRRAFAPWEWILAFRYLRAKRNETGVGLITAIAFWAIALAIAVLIVVMSIMNGFRAELLAKILGFEAHAYVTGEQAWGENYPAAVERLKQAPGVVEAFPTVSSYGMLEGQQARPAQLRGIRAEDLRGLKVIADNVEAGSLEDFGKITLFDPAEDEDVEGLYPHIVIGYRLAGILGVGAGDVVDVITLGGPSTPFGGGGPVNKFFRVGAVFNVGMSEYDELFAFIPLEVAQPLFGRGADIDAIEVKVADPDRMDLYMPAVRQAAGPGAVVSDWRDANASYWGALQVERNMMRLVLMLIVAIAALNIISALVMLVKNKERDIAILRTVGASQGSVMRVFLISGAAIGVLAAPTGVILGVLFCLNIARIQAFLDWVFRTQVFNPDIYFLSSLPAKLDWAEVWLVFIWTLSVSILVTLYPSWRASRTDPVETLRYE